MNIQERLLSNPHITLTPKRMKRLGINSNNEVETDKAVITNPLKYNAKTSDDGRNTLPERDPQDQ